MKKILMFIPESAGSAATRFEDKITGIAGNRISCICRDEDSLEREFRKPWALYDLAILFAGTEEQLEYFISLQEVMEGLPVLMVLPGSRRDICKRAHLLRPRFMSFADSDFSDFAAVLEKMILNWEETCQRSGRAVVTAGD